MVVLCRKRGEKVYSTATLDIVVSEINGTSAQFAVSDRRAGRMGLTLSTDMCELCRNKCCYFRFRPGGGMLMIHCAKGKSVWLVGARCLTVIDICAGNITVAITKRLAVERLEGR